MTTRSLRATAFHEAGHAVVALTHPYGREVVEATIVPSADTLGRVRHHDWSRRFRPDVAVSPVQHRRLEASIVGSLAGVIAEQRATGRRHDWLGARHDTETAADVAAYLTGSPRQAELYLRFLDQVARDRVKRHWAAIERVAEALLGRETLTGRELRDLVCAVSTE